MNTAGVRRLRGEKWAERLCTELQGPPAEADRWMQCNTELLKRDAHSCVGLLTLQGTGCYLKLYLHKSRWQRLALRLGWGRGISAFDRALKLRAAGVPVPEPRACLYLPEGLMLLTEALQGRDLKALWQAGVDGERGAQLMRAAGNAVAGLHLAGFAHGDCKWSNLLCAQEGCYLADLEAVRAAPLGSAATLRDLARFTLNGEDLALPLELYADFLEAYLGRTGLDPERVRKGVLTPLRELRRRHLARYGERGHRLLGDS